MPSAHRSYGHRYRQARARCLAGKPLCTWCNNDATTADHVPALAEHVHVEGTDCCVLVPSCWPCNSTRGARLGNARMRAGGPLRRGSGWSASHPTMRAMSTTEPTTPTPDAEPDEPAEPEPDAPDD